MGKDGKETPFCQSNKCSCVVFLLIVGGVAAVVCVTLLVKDLRSIYDHDGGGESEAPWWKKTIIYQIYPRSFQDSDGDGVGDLQGIISRLWYFNYLNVGAIWLSPFFTSPMKDFGYDVSNYTEVDPLFGDMDDFDNLIKEAKSKGIKVIIDFVPNHTSNESSWFDLSRHAADESDPYWNFYIWNEGTTNPDGSRSPPDNWKSVFEGSAWEWDDVRKAYYYHAFLSSQPDLNYRNEHVLEKIDEVIRFWMDKGVDGLRIDAIPHLFEIANQSIDEPAGASNGFDENLHKYIKNQPEIFKVVKRWRAILDTYEAADGTSRFLLAETVGIPHEARMNYYKAGSVPFFFNLIPAKEKCGATATCFLEIIRDGMNLTEGQWPNFVIGNHDNKRIADRMGDVNVDAMNMMLLTLPGTPTTYYGEELGMRGGDYTGMTPKDPYAITSNNAENSRDSERNPMQWNDTLNAGFSNSTTGTWLPIQPNTDYMHINVEVERNLDNSSLNLYRKLAELRQKEAFQNANIEFPESVSDVLVYVRGVEGDRYAVALNFGEAKHGIDITKLGYTKGTLVLSTKSEKDKTIDLSNIQLDKGEGFIVHLDE
ncbi:maltase A2-like [Mercenaria mercenaria]|uniref:maltase A2-like n=1 Tax=Mercenaria mercenaria TaxID=6596 RepID=UPI00234FA641|nr:maltase A2-like [Mercenaria mercenaria]